MPSLSGSLIDVTSAPSDATEVWIRAADGRVSGANVVLEESRRVPVTGGKFTVTVLPGRAHLVVIHAGMSQEHVPLLVQDGMTTIAEAVRLGDEDWAEYSPSEAEQIKAEIAAEVAKAATSAQAAKNAQQAAEKARTDTQNALGTKADKVHTHAIGDVTGLQSALDGKADKSHRHVWAEIDDKPETFPPATHTHTTAQVTGLDTALAGKAAQADLVALQTLLAGIMPYGMTFKPTAGSSYVNNPASSSTHISGHGLALPSALVTVSASWTGAEECGFYLNRNGTLIELGTIPAKSGGGVSSPVTAQLGGLEGDFVYLYCRPAWNGEGSPTGTITVIPTAT